MRFLAFLGLVTLSGSFAGCIGDIGGDDGGSVPVAAFDVFAVEDATDTFAFDASRSKGSLVNYLWDFGDGKSENRSSPAIEHAYEFTNGIYTVTLIVTDKNNVNATARQQVRVGSGQNQIPAALFSMNTRRAGLNESITFDASASRDADADPLTYHWDFNWPIEEADYVAFKKGKAAGGGDEEPAPENKSEDDGGGDYPQGPSNAGGPGLPSLPLPTPVRPRHGGGEEGPNRNALYTKTEVTTESVTHAEFPMEGIYYVQLRACDVKRECGEEIWPVLIEENPPSASFHRTWEGELLVGNPLITAGPENSTNLPDAGENSTDDAATVFDLDFPAHYMVVNITFNAQTLPDPSGTTANTITFFVQPRGYASAFFAQDVTGGSASIEFANGVPEAGDVNMRIVATRGALIEFTAEVWAHLDTNPFADEEAEFATGGDAHAGHGGA